jgi:O-antigen/teichoic acid export membrane protein
MTTTGRAGRAAAVYLLLMGLQRGVSLLILPFVSHAMSPEEYGGATILATTAPLLVTLAAAPLGQLAFRALSRPDDSGAAWMRVAGIYCYLVMPLVGMAMAGVIAVAVPELLGVSGAIWAIELVAMGFLPAATYYAIPSARARHDLQAFIWLALTSVAVTAASKLLLVVTWQMGVLGWAISDLLSAVVSYGLAIAIVRLPKIRVRATHIREVTAFSVPLIPHVAAFWAASSLSRPALALVSTLTQVGLLSMGLNMASVAALILTEINQAALPHYARERFPAPSPETLRIVRWQLFLSIAVPALVGAITALGGPLIIASQYWSSFWLVGVMLVGQLAFGLYLIPMNYVVQTAGQTRFSSIASVTGAVLMMVGIFSMGQTGAIGAAYAITAGYIGMAAVALLLTRLLKIQFRWSSLRSCLPEAATAAVGLGLSIAALASPARSQSACLFSTGCIILVLVGFVSMTLRRESDSQ